MSGTAKLSFEEYLMEVECGITWEEFSRMSKVEKECLKSSYKEWLKGLDTSNI